VDILPDGLIWELEVIVSKNTTQEKNNRVGGDFSRGDYLLKK